MNKKLLIIIGVVVIAAAIGLVFFLFLSKDDAALGPITSSDSPFGTGGGEAADRPAPVGNGDGNAFSGGEVFGNLKKISGSPISGSIFLTTGSSTSVRFVEKATSHVYEYDLGSSFLKKITNTTIPKIEEALWFPNGKSFIGRYEKEGRIESFIGTVGTTTSTSTGSYDEAFDLLVKFLPTDISQINISPAGTQIFYLAAGPDGAEGVLANANGTKPQAIWQSKVVGWLTSWQNNASILLTTKPSHNLPGYSYFLNPQTKVLSSALREIVGLTTLSSPDNQKILYSESKSGITSLFLSNQKDKTSVLLPFSTFPEKCVWIGNTKVVCAVPSRIGGDMPDAWYKGLAALEDTLISFDISSGEVVEVSNLKDASQKEVDAINLQVSKNQDYVSFINKRDGTFWVLKI